MNRLTFQAVRIAACVALVVVPFGYAITGLHTDVLMGVGCGLATGMGVGLRGGSESGLWIGIVVGSIVGMVASLLAGLLQGNPWGYLGPPVLALAVGLITGLRGSSPSGYRDMIRETFIMAALLAIGLLPVLGAMGVFSDLSELSLTRAVLPVMPFLMVPTTALVAGLLSHRRDGWRDTRPPRLLVIGVAAVLVFLIFMFASGRIDQGARFGQVALAIVLSVAVVPGSAFLAGRAVITWLQPRLRVYDHLADYLRVMWVPIGGFAVGYLTIIVLFAGFYGMLGRFSPGAFSDGGGGPGIADWLFFSFFTALGQDFLTVSPNSVGARVLVGVHLILSAGWVVVLFAAVMTSIGPKLERIARRQGGSEGAGGE